MTNLEEQIYNRTNKGLDIIQRYIPDARPGKKFKLREEERTPSACIKEDKGVFYIKDFGDNQPRMNAIGLIMFMEGLQYWEAVNREADRLGITTNYTPPKPIIQKTQTTDKDGFKIVDSTDWNDFDKDFWKVPKQVLEKYGWRKVLSYTQIKDGSKLYIEATNEYPIYIRRCGEFQKIYKPFDANYRFMIVGNKTPGYLNGIHELEVQYNSRNANLKEDERETKVPEVIICSGERDAMVVASFGYYPVWKNSETEKLDYQMWATLTKYAAKVYNIPDIDETGVKCGYELALQYIDLYTVEIPSWIQQYRDVRGKIRKDIRDYVELRPKKSDFEKLLQSAKQAKFWSIVEVKDSTRVIINELFLIHFLKLNLFGKIVDDNKVETYVRIKNDIVSEITITDIKDMVNSYMHDHGFDMKVQERVFQYLRQNSSIINDLPTIKPNFINYTNDSQYFQFKDRQIRVTANGIENVFNSRINYWEKQVIQHNFKLLDPSFTATDKDIKIHNIDSRFFRFIINTSRIYWREELETRAEANKEEDKIYQDQHQFSIDGNRLTPIEIDIQKKNLINKLYAIGYLLHRNKQLSRTLAIWVVENKITAVNQSSGGSGKSFIFNGINHLLNVATFNGRDKHITEDKHLLGRIKDDTNIMLIDDANKSMDLNYWYTAITGNLLINPKGKEAREIPFEKSPKIAFTSNFAPSIKNSDSSSLRRLLFVVMSDWYHTATQDNGYKETRRIYDDFGMDLLQESTYKEEYFNQDFNFMLNCLQFYLQCCQKNIYKIEADTTNIFKRIDKQNRGDYFDEWAEAFFDDEMHFGTRLNQNTVYDNCMFETGIKMTKQSFKQKLKTYCNDNNIELNPSTDPNWYQGRIRVRENGNLVEYLLFQKKMINPGDKEKYNQVELLNEIK